MPRHLFLKLRMVAAILVVSGGISGIASLWFRELDQQAVMALLIGAVYLIIGIGLFGQSRFTLFVAIIASATHIWWRSAALTNSDAALTPILALTADTLTILICTLVLWHVRREPSA